ncbi:MAG: hypothetical protein R3B95_14310 [Nitrospirales bacterium]|nr:hypothetical protein [Nitrospirales bacterium]
MIRSNSSSLYFGVRVSLLLVLLWIPAMGKARAEELGDRRSNLAPQDLQELWSQLDDARSYRCMEGRVCPAGGDEKMASKRCTRKDYDRLLLDYRNDLPSHPGKTPEAIFQFLLGPEGFQVFLADPLWSKEAAWGIRETLNEVMAAQLALGNDKLLLALRTRFPNAGDPADSNPTRLLDRSIQDFNQGINLAMEDLRKRPKGLRAHGAPDAALPFFVENAAPPSKPEGEVVESDLNRLTELVLRRGIANNVLGRRKFFIGNVSPAGRQDAMDELKKSAQATFLHTAILAAEQGQEDFQHNKGYELKTQVLDAQQIFENILAGFNPLELLGDFIPRASTNSKISSAISSVNKAQRDEENAKKEARDFDHSQTQLKSELETQRIHFLDRISALTGIPTYKLPPDLSESPTRLTFLKESETRIADCIEQRGNCQGELGALAREIQLAVIDAQVAEEQLKSIPEQIRIELERQQAVADIIFANGEAQSVLTVSIQIAEAVTSCACGTASGVITSFGQIQTAPLRGEKEMLQAIGEATIAGINSDAVIKNLLLQQVQALIAVQRAGLIIDAKREDLRRVQGELERVVRNYGAAHQNFVCAYFSNPAYRLQLSQAQRNADLSFDAAMVQSYYAAKALEYEWAELLRNPFACPLDSGQCPIGDSEIFNPILRSESVFASASAGSTGSPNPTLHTFLDALSKWDFGLREAREARNEAGAVLTFSMRKDILGFASDGVVGSEDEGRSILRFQDFLAQHRIPGSGEQDDLEFDFTLQIHNQKFFPARPNLKIKSLKINLVSRDGFTLGSLQNAPLVGLIMRGRTFLRTFDDSLLNLKLEETPDLSDSRFGTLLSASVNGFPIVLPDSTLENLSPAVSRWTLTIDMDQGSNPNLILENLADIELTFDYRFGAPQEFIFSGL